MEQNQIMGVSEQELAELLRSMPDNVVIRVIFNEEAGDGERE